MTVSGQEVLTKDNMSIKISLLVRYEITDAKAAMLADASVEQTLYALSQIALREIVGTTNIDDLLATRSEMDETLRAKVAPQTEELGLSLLSLSIKDIMFPGPLKEAFAQTARAKQDGQALLERARGETAALRNLANAARMMEKSPQMFQIRLLQALTESKGSVVVQLTPGTDGPVMADVTEPS